VNDKNREFLKIMKDIYDVSNAFGIKTYIWGGFAVDILNGGFTREHGDLDCTTENLVENLGDLKDKYTSLGYSVNYLEDFWMLQITNEDGLNATFNTVRNVDGIAHWHLIGPHGTVFFPYEWLDKTVRSFNDLSVYTVGAHLSYVIKANVKLISPEWKIRDKDKADMVILERILSSNGINKKVVEEKVWSHHPYWFTKGYLDYFFPIRT